MLRSLIIIILLFFFVSHFQSASAVSTPAGPFIKHLSSILKWTSSKSSPKSSNSGDGPVIQFESGYLVETVVEGNALGVIPHLIRVSQEGELFAVDSENSNIVRVTPPLSQYSRARLVAGSFQGRTGHVDGKPSDARFNHPKGVTMDDKGNVYVADTENLAIRKIGDGGVTTIAGGKSNIAGYRDGPSEDAKFSSDFDVVYVPSTCSLLVVDRGNAALRQISLNQEDCDANNSTISASDIVMVIGAVLVGYASSLLHQGLGSTLFSKFLQPSESDIHGQQVKEKSNIILDSSKSGPVASPGWPSIGQLATDFSKLAREMLNNSLAPFLPSQFAGLTSRKGLTPLKDRLKMPEDEVNPRIAQKQTTPAPRTESWQAYPASATDKNPEMKASKISRTESWQAYPASATDKNPEMKASKIRSNSLKDPSLPSKHRSSKRQEYAEFYGTSETPQHVGQTRSKSQKERSKHRHHRDKSGEVVTPGPNTVEPKPSVAMNYMDPKFDPYNVRNRYMPDGSYRY